MVITHEDGWLGPYFARHALFKELNAENLTKLQKNCQVELARQWGWL